MLDTYVELSTTSGVSYLSPSCENPTIVKYNLALNASANYEGDTASLWIRHGDGQISIYNNYILHQNGYSIDTITHTYKYPGIYSVMYSIYTSDGLNGDTLIQYDKVNIKDTCGNISGMVFNDVNNDSVYNLGDILLPNIQIKLVKIINTDMTETIEWTHTDSNGYYEFSIDTIFNYRIELANLLT